jgi:hypothetical protein
MNDIGHMMQTRSGRDMINALAHNTNHHTLRITGNDPDAQNATTNATGPGAVGTDAHPGAGSDATITYNPGSVWVPRPGARRGEPWMPMRSDIQLMHEMSHALHMTHGTLADGSLVTRQELDRAHVGRHDPARRDIGNEANSEHQAVGIGAYRHDPLTEDAYRRERIDMARHHARGLVTGVGGDAHLRMRRTYGEYGLGARIGHHHHHHSAGGGPPGSP